MIEQAITAIRRDNLNYLIARFNGVSAVAQALGLRSPSYISQLSNGSKLMGSKFARKVEDKYQLPFRLMDSKNGVKDAIEKRQQLPVAPIPEPAGLSKSALKELQDSVSYSDYLTISETLATIRKLNKKQKQALIKALNTSSHS